MIRVKNYKESLLNELGILLAYEFSLFFAILSAPLKTFIQTYEGEKQKPIYVGLKI